MKTKIAAFIAVGVIFIGAGGYFLKTLYFPTPEIVVNTQDTTAVATSTDQQPNTWQSNTIFSTEKDWVYAANGIPNLVSTSTTQTELTSVANGIVSCYVYTGPTKRTKKELQPEADLASFQILTANNLPHYMRDKNYVWDEYCNRLDEADPKTFVTASLWGGEKHFNGEARFNKDTQHVWVWGKKIQGADPATFSIIEHDNVGSGMLSEGFFSRDKNHVYYSFSENDATPENGNNSTSSTKIIEQANPETFLLIERNGYNNIMEQTGYSTDGSLVFYLDNRVIGADPKTFEVKDPQEPWTNCDNKCLNGDARDKDHVYFYGKIVN